MLHFDLNFSNVGKILYPLHFFPLAPMHKNHFLHLYICQDIGKKFRYMSYIIEKKSDIYEFFYICFDFHVLSLLCIDFFVVLK